jgi:hypothetical protein
MRPRSLIASFGAAVGVCLFSAAPATAQYRGIDPYRPYTSQYDDFVTPSVPTNGGLPNAARYERDLATGGEAGRYQRSNRISEALGLDEERDGSLIDGGTGRDDRPRYRAKQDERFFMDQKERERLYFEASQERDPKKRAEKMKAYQEAVRKSARGAERSTTSRTGTKGGAKREDLTSRLARDIVDGTPRTSESAARNPGPAARNPAPAGRDAAKSSRATEFNPRRAGAAPAAETRRDAEKEAEEPEARSPGGRYDSRPDPDEPERKGMLGGNSRRLSERLKPTDLLYRSMDRSRRFRESTGTTPAVRPESAP